MRTREKVALVIAILAGVFIGLCDASPNWDDTGITVAAIALAASIASFLAPRLWVYIALAVGVWVPLIEINRLGFGPFMALVVSFGAAAAGTACERLANGAKPTTTKDSN